MEEEMVGVGDTIRCPRCGRVYELPTELPLTLVESTIYEPVEVVLD